MAASPFDDAFITPVVSEGLVLSVADRLDRVVVDAGLREFAKFHHVPHGVPFVLDDESRADFVLKHISCTTVGIASRGAVGVTGIHLIRESIDEIGRVSVVGVLLPVRLPWGAIGVAMVCDVGEEVTHRGGDAIHATGIAAGVDPQASTVLVEIRHVGNDEFVVRARAVSLSVKISKEARAEHDGGDGARHDEE